MKNFRAIRVHQVEKTLQSKFETLSLDQLTPGEVVIKVAYSCLNFKDALAVSGKSRIMRSMPRVAGIDLSGTVESSSDARYKAGDPVLVTGCNLGELLDGGLAEMARVPADAVVRLPLGLSLFEAMALGTAGFTAAMALRRMLENHQSPDMGPIVVTGPTGGVGSIAIQLFKRAGFEVAALTGKKAAAEDYLKGLGADEVIDRESFDMGKKPLEAARFGGAVDNLGGETLAGLTRVVKPWGNIGSIGLAQGHELHTTVMPFILRGVSLLGIHSVDVPRAWREDIWNKLAGDWKPANLDRIVHRTITLDEVPAACGELMASAVQGRYVVKLG
ncbi:MAG: YhdH/YhfP family quinone oxidoreductase [Panacagrimonas sp.]